MKMREECRKIIRYLLFFFLILECLPNIQAEKTTEDYGKSSTNSKETDNFFKRGLSTQRLTKDIIQTIGRGLLDPGVISFLGPLLMAGLVALPFLAPSAIIPLAGLVSSVRGRKKRDLEESIGQFVIKDLPEIINRVVSKDQKNRGNGQSDKPITLEDIQRKLEEVINNKNV